MKIKTLETEADLEEVSASCGHFSFSLLKFGEQLKDLLAILDELQLESEEKPNGRSWNWLKFWRPANAHESGRSVSDLGGLLRQKNSSSTLLTGSQSSRLLILSGKRIFGFDAPVQKTDLI